MLKFKSGQISMLISLIVAIIALMILVGIGFVSSFFNWPGEVIKIREEVSGSLEGAINLITLLKIKTQNYGDMREAVRLYMITKDSDIKDQMNDIIIGKYENEVSLKLKVNGDEEDIGVGVWGYGSEYELPVAYPEGNSINVRISSMRIFFTDDLYPSATL